MFKIETQLYLNKQNECYQKLITIHPKPSDELGSLVKQLNRNPLSKFEYANSNTCDCNYKPCFSVITNPQTNKPFCIDELTEFINLIVEYGYSINTSISKLIIKNPNTNNSDNFLFFIVKS